LSREWAERLTACDQNKRQVLSVHRMVPGPLTEQLHEGDLLLAIDGTPVSTFMRLESAVTNPTARLTILRDAAVVEKQVTCSKVVSDGTHHIVMWCGLVVQKAYRAVLERGFSPKCGGVYISYYLFGSPAHKYKLLPKHWIVELNGTPITDLTCFLELIQRLTHGTDVRVKTCDLNGKLTAYTLKTDHNYWRSYEVYRKEDEWVLHVLAEPNSSSPAAA